MKCKQHATIVSPSCLANALESSELCWCCEDSKHASVLACYHPNQYLLLVCMTLMTHAGAARCQARLQERHAGRSHRLSFFFALAGSVLSCFSFFICTSCYRSGSRHIVLLSDLTLVTSYKHHQAHDVCLRSHIMACTGVLWKQGQWK